MANKNLWSYHYEHYAFQAITRQVYNLFQALWNNFEGGEWVQKSFGVKAGQTDRHQTYRTGGASGAAKNPSSEHFVKVIIPLWDLFSR